MSQGSEEKRGLELILLNPLHYSGLGLRSTRAWLDDVVRDVAPDSLSLGVLFTSNRGIADLNLRFRCTSE